MDPAVVAAAAAAAATELNKSTTAAVEAFVHRMPYQANNGTSQDQIDVEFSDRYNILYYSSRYFRDVLYSICCRKKVAK
jgi:hypothetical protein